MPSDKQCAVCGKTTGRLLPYTFQLWTLRELGAVVVQYPGDFAHAKCMKLIGAVKQRRTA